MKRTLALLVLALACREDAPVAIPKVGSGPVEIGNAGGAPVEIVEIAHAGSAPVEIVHAEKPESPGGDDKPLPPTAANGEPWGSYRYVLKELRTCSPELLRFWRIYKGVCVDGKRFLTRSSGFVSETRYFAGEKLVGISTFSDTGGTVRWGDARCEVAKEASLCKAPAPRSIGNGTDELGI